MKKTIFLIMLLSFNISKGQILLTTSMECKLIETPNNGGVIISSIPSYRNLELLEYVKDDFFKVKFENTVGYINKTFIAYCENYYHAINVEKEGITSLYSNNKSAIDKINRQKISDEKFYYPNIKIAYFKEIQESIQKPKELPILTISEINFHDKTDNNRIDGNESCFIEFTISNSGKGRGNNIVAKVQDKAFTKGLSFNSSFDIGSIEPNSIKKIEIPIVGTFDLTSSVAKIGISFEEKFGFQPDPIELNIETKEFSKPEVRVVDYSFLTNNGTIKLGLPVQLKILVQNIGQGIEENVNVNFQIPSKNIFPNGSSSFEINTLQSGESKEFVFEFIANKLYSDKTIPITIQIAEKYGKFSENKQTIANIDSKTSSITINIASNSNDNKVNIQIASLSSEVDKNIPFNPNKNSNKYALIIGNEDYSSRQTELNQEVNVAFAINDAKTFKEYCVNTLGFEEKNIFFLCNATAGEMQQKIELVTQILKKVGSSSELIFYYAGHGFPDENTKEPYLIPVDVSATNLTSAIKLYDVYNKFSQTEAGRITIFLDACFTGGGRESGLLTARGVKVRPKKEVISGKMVIFAATSEDQTALPFKETQHGMFTFFLLKKMQESKGEVSYGELEKYLIKNVSLESLRVNSKPQDPTVILSPEVISNWETWKLK